MVKENVAVSGNPATVALAVTVYGPPAMRLAVKGTPACPAKSETAETAPKVPPGPDAGAAKFTVTPDIGPSKGWNRFTERLNGVPIFPDWGVSPGVMVGALL